MWSTIRLIAREEGKSGKISFLRHAFTTNEIRTLNNLNNYRSLCWIRGPSNESCAKLSNYVFNVRAGKFVVEPSTHF